MIWEIALGVAIGVLLISFVWAICAKKMRYKIIIGGVAVSTFAMYFPIYINKFEGESFRIFKTFVVTIQKTIKSFGLSGDLFFFMDNSAGLEPKIRDVYLILAIVLIILAPLITFIVALSFFKNASAYMKFYRKYYSDTYVFSELNEEALALAKSLKSNNKKRTIVFTDVFENNDDDGLQIKAKELGAILFKKDILGTKFSFHSKESKITFFIMGADDDENLSKTLSLIERYGENENMLLYVFTTSINSELLLSKSATGKMKVRRINRVQSLISRHLYDNGMSIFENAIQSENEEKLISALIIGLGESGMEMTKALSWFGQMDGYKLEVNVFDIDGKASERLCYDCPELMDEKHNHDFQTKGEAHYSIDVHAGIDVQTKEFLDRVDKVNKPTYIFISLGCDKRNIQMAVTLRTWLLKKGCYPRIDAVVRDVNRKDALAGITNYSGQEYDIHFIGDTKTSYSEEVIFESDIEEEALKRHMKWGKEEEFWKFEYNYRSSVASAIHRKMKILCKIPGADKEPHERTEEEKWALRELEHRRWNAYMRSEGFTYAKKRNNLAKTHHCLVPFDELSLEEQEKDDD